MKQLVIPLAILGMLALIGAAVVWDCVRLAADDRHRVALADGEMQKHEMRLVKLLSGYTKISPEVQSSIAGYQSAAGPATDNNQARHDAYESVVASFRKTVSTEIDPTNPLDRAFMDDVAGTINRREIAKKQYDEESTAYQGFLSSWRGRLARSFSLRARADWKPNGRR
jgi:hypothetical protein